MKYNFTKYLKGNKCPHGRDANGVHPSRLYLKMQIRVNKPLAAVFCVIKIVFTTKRVFKYTYLPI